jgi:transcription termination factor Rho
VPVSGGSFDSGPEEAAQAAELAMERAKRTVERGGDAVVVVDSLAALNPGAARRLFGAGRRAEEGGSLTVIAAVGESSEYLRIASTRIVLEPSASGASLATDRSGALRADLLR